MTAEICTLDSLSIRQSHNESPNSCKQEGFERRVLNVTKHAFHLMIGELAVNRGFKSVNILEAISSLHRDA